jgi:anti-sigma factor RsiW
VSDTTPSRLALGRFEALLDLHGADLARFPEEERAAAAALLAADPRAQRLHAQALALEAGLSGMAEPEPSAALRRAVAEIPLRHPQPAAGAAPLLPLRWRSAWALVASAALMVALGALSGSMTRGVDLTALAGGSTEVEEVEPGMDDSDPLAELAELAFASDLDDELAP